VINTGTTVATFLTIFVLQHSQNRDATERAPAPAGRLSSAKPVTNRRCATNCRCGYTTNEALPSAASTWAGVTVAGNCKTVAI
jgi:hypothetical protein